MSFSVCDDSDFVWIYKYVTSENSILNKIPTTLNFTKSQECGACTFLFDHSIETPEVYTIKNENGEFIRIGIDCTDPFFKNMLLQRAVEFFTPEQIQIIKQTEDANFDEHKLVDILIEYRNFNGNFLVGHREDLEDFCAKGGNLYITCIDPDELNVSDGDVSVIVCQKHYFKKLKKEFWKYVHKTSLQLLSQTFTPNKKTISTKSSRKRI